MELYQYLKQLEAVEMEAKELSDIAGVSVRIYVEKWFTIHIEDENDCLLYMSDCDDIDSLYNELSALIIGAKLAKNIVI